MPVQTASEIQRVSDIQRIDNALQENNSYYAGLIQRLHNLGHRLKDTNVPEKMGKEASIPTGNGLIYDIETHLEYYRNHNANLETVINKLEELI